MKKSIFFALMIGMISASNAAHADGPRKIVTPELESNVMTFVSVMASGYQAYQHVPLSHNKEDYDNAVAEREKYKRIKEACERASKVYAITPAVATKGKIRFQEMNLEQNSLESSKRFLHNMLVKNSKESIDRLKKELPGSGNTFWSQVGSNFRSDLLFYARSIESDIWLKRYDSCAKKIGNILTASKAIEQ